MHYQNKLKRFILRKDFFKRVKNRIKKFNRKVSKNEFDDIFYLFTLYREYPKVIFDCGANIGFVTHQFLKFFPTASVYAFEPNPSIFKKLQTYYQNNTRVFCHNKGIADQEGTLLFNVNKNAGTSSFLKPNAYHVANMASKKNITTEVKVTSISAFMKEENITHIDLLKLDIEGYEIKALEGIERLNEQVSVIFTEVNLIPTYEGQPLIEDVILYARKNGFHLYNFYGINENINKQASITNLLFISTHFKNQLIEKGYQQGFGY